MNVPDLDGVAMARSLAAWFARRPDVLGVLLVGSHARDEAGPESDIDLVVLTKTPESYRVDKAWHELLPWGDRAATVLSFRDVAYGLLWSRHVTFALQVAGRGILEVEFGFAPMEWAATAPPDPGTVGVIRDGCLVMFDREGILDRLIASVSSTPDA